MGFRVCTYNMGGGAGDFEFLCKYHNPQFKVLKEEEPKFDADYKTQQEYVSAKIKDLADVYFLQEVLSLDRPLLKALKERKFHIVYKKHDTQPDVIPDSVIAVSSDFVNGQDLSQYIKGDRVPICSFTHQPTNQRFTFASFHAFGFKLDPLDPQEAKDGDDFCSEIQKVVEASNHFCIIGADFNADPEKYRERFRPFREANFTIHPLLQPTNVNPKSETYRERELDFILSRGYKGLSSYFQKNVVVRVLADKPLGFTPQTNASDHIPVFAKVTIT